MRILHSFSSLCLSVMLGTSAFAADHKPITRVLRPGAQDPGPGAVANIAGTWHMSAPEYKDLKAASLTLLRKFSPRSHYFVFLGRDAAPISAFVQNLGGKELAVNFPASSNESGRDTPTVMGEYVHRIIPKEALAGDRKIVIVDATTSGRALDYWVPKLQPHMPRVTVIKAAYGVTGGGILNNPGDKVVFPTSEFPNVDQYYTGSYENGIAEYPRHAPGAHPVSDIATSRPEWTMFRQAIMNRMQADTELDKALTEIGGVREVTPEARRQAKAAAAAGRKQQAAELVELRRYPTTIKADAKNMLGSLGARGEGHKQGPYLGENGTVVNAWLVSAIAKHEKASEASVAARQAGPNQVTLFFITEVLEHALAGNQIRNRDYRRLLGHALGFSVMDGPMLSALAKHFEKSSAMQRELTHEAEYYQQGSSKQPAGTEQMAANYTALMTTLGR